MNSDPLDNLWLPDTVRQNGVAELTPPETVHELSDRPQAHQYTFTFKYKGKEKTILIVDKAEEIGNHILSGAVMDPRGISALYPDWRERGFPIEGEVKDDWAEILPRYETSRPHRRPRRRVTGPGSLRRAADREPGSPLPLRARPGSRRVG